MSAQILEGKTLAASIRSTLQSRIGAVNNAKGRPPRLAAVSYKEDYASEVYLNKELAVCEKAGIKTSVSAITRETTPEQFSGLLRGLSSDPGVDAVLVPRPIPDQLNNIRLWESLSPDKDIDGASVLNMGRLFLCRNFREIEELDIFAPCTAWAVVRLMLHHGIKVSGKRIAVAGRSSTVGKPLAHMLSCLDGTVTLCHSRTPDIASALKSADIVISAVGRARWIKKEMLGSGQILIDVGTNSDENGVFCGDMDYDGVSAAAAAVTPVPGGVGPVTLACLLENIVRSAERTGAAR